MALEEFYYLSQVVAAVAIVLSLLVLVVEVRRNTREIKRQSTAEVTSQRSTFVRYIGTDKQVARVVGRGLSGEGLAPAEWFQFNMFLYAIFVEFELNRRKQAAGEIDADLWEAWLEAYRWWLQFPGVRKWWSTRPAGFTADFRRFVDGELETTEPADARLLAEFSRIDPRPE